MGNAPKQPQPVDTGNAISEALAALRAQETRFTEATATLASVQSAIDKAHTHINQHRVAQTHLDALSEARKPLLAAGYMGTDNADALAANAKEIAALERQVTELAPAAHDAESAIPELEARYTEAAAPVRVLGVEIGACRYRLLTACAEQLLESYGVAIDAAMDKYVEIVALASEINGYGRAANLPRIGPESPQPMTFPAVNIGRWKAANTAGAGPNEMTAARARLAQRLQALGIK